jgi:UDP-N-acetylmuramoyl-L-alanyl-D-glutamate--2,6-diaminopimelate ligase
MDLNELISGLDIRVAGGRDSPPSGGVGVRVCDLTEDSRTVVPGSLFIARRGAVWDGGKFIDEAASLGAVAVLMEEGDGLHHWGGGSGPLPRGVVGLTSPDVPLATAMLAERFYGNPSRKLFLAGVTGTNGKTTVAWLIHRILRGAGLRCGLMGTVVVDDGTGVAPATLTTPPATELSRTLGVMVDAGCAAAVLEVSSHALAQSRPAGLSFDAAVFTNLTGDHLDYHETPERYAGAKAKLFGSLGEDAWAVVNADDPAHERILRGCRAKVLKCSTEGQGDRGTEGRGWCWARALRSGMGGTGVEFHGPWGEIYAELKLVGEYNVMNALQAVAVAHLAGLTAEQITPRLEVATAPPGRLEPVSGPEDPINVLVDYAHTDDALEKVLMAVSPLVPGRLWVVFGCGGDRDRTKRPRMAAVACEHADSVVITSDNPRTESPSQIIADIRGGLVGPVGELALIEPDRRRAIRLAVESAAEGDVVVIAGKGHEDYQILPDGRGGTVRQHFDDREEARRALRERREPRPAARVEGS